MRGYSLVHGPGQSSHAALIDGHVTFLVEDHVGIDDISAVDQLEFVPVRSGALEDRAVPFNCLAVESLTIVHPVSDYLVQTGEAVVEKPPVVASAAPVELQGIMLPVHFHLREEPCEDESQCLGLSGFQRGLQGYGASSGYFSRGGEQFDILSGLREFPVFSELFPCFPAFGYVE